MQAVFCILDAAEKHILLKLLYRPTGLVFSMLSSAKQIIELVSPIPFYEKNQEKRKTSSCSNTN